MREQGTEHLLFNMNELGGCQRSQHEVSRGNADTDSLLGSIINLMTSKTSRVSRLDKVLINMHFFR